MSKRLLDKKIVKISFSESPDDQEDYNCSWDVNFSSDEDIFFKGKSEILWSRTGNLFEYSDSPQSFSDLTGTTLSSCSWHNDEFDMKSTSKVNASLEAIDTALYEQVKSPFMSETLFQECCDWAEKFSYFRIKGEQIFKPDDNFSFYPTNTMCMKQCDLRRPNTSLHLEGRKLPLYGTNNPKGVYFDCASDNKVLNCFEDVVGEDAFEECFALHESDGLGESVQVLIADNVKSASSIKALQEKVLDKLVSEMWPSVISFLEKLDDKNSLCDDLQLPPIIVATEQKRALSSQRPKTEGCSSFITEFPKLENMLTVSPKILQKRDIGNGCVNHLTRPNSEMSVNLCLSSKSLKSMCHQKSSIDDARRNTDSVFTKGNRSEREPENLCFVLPALEEDFQDTSSFLRGFHIEPGRKDALPKPVLSSRNEYEAVSTSRTSEYFLPPIKDKGYVPANVKLTKNLFTFYGPPVIPNRNKTISSAKFKKTNSRPSTSVSKKTIRNDEVPQQLSLNNGLYITAKNIVKNPSNPSVESNIDEPLGDNEEPVETSQEKSVTLFPIVTPLTPHEDKSHLSRKGLLHNFLGGRKR